MSVVKPLAALGLSLALLGSVGSVSAQESSQVEPDVTIRQEQDRTIREYRVNGQLYAIRIEPSIGPAYYLLDDDGDGNFERQEGDRVAVPSWVLIEW
ncbi:DUF2782 domain-containing protein [Pistricoccus aurantiacus]|uniref:DUF2782 domain-containing protein n=1 Tax=Pistricoccus aurantiacus TaxID=1883414 RepID=A0A5B8SSA4_9GAMM|nr:DUF2782 domain-containing protein [Pistricoccus aurantiacus]QEA38877.1 DUF2782 domain-containing protein [Pistricoccus aurantiacus]